MKKLSRHKHRIIALQILYSLDIKGQLVEQKVKEEFLKLQGNPDAEDLDCIDKYYQEITVGVVISQEKLDENIQRFAVDWELERISAITRNILRIALWEIENEVPTGVVINEAVDLAKEFAGKKESSFVNGILGKSVIS
ncbi:MAG: transcription antitermination factor NusB [Bacillota bacterium]